MVINVNVTLAEVANDHERHKSIKGLIIKIAILHQRICDEYKIDPLQKFARLTISWSCFFIMNICKLSRVIFITLGCGK